LWDPTRWPTATTSHDLFHHIDRVLLRILSSSPASTSRLIRFNFPHLLHHVHQIAHPSQLLQQPGVNRLAHLLCELFGVPLQRIEVVAHPADVHLAHLLHHVTEFMILLQEEDDLLGVRTGALGDAHNTCFIESFLYHIC
jgi:hypothetical protein